ncbi:fimbria/pilus periplasmic chaperone [Photobacterium damselae]|uniref:fimbria/pilus periplasmic chaperone n=1 Tax=Photobacterium damselae TaxID=38293 RepID=UPI001EED497C|nr:fimbria/pilus periplasmic chaperone [Photobacterium damselae]UKA03989.1 fimbria/pilus periplasmic chaperone [Photobacterium damselae subsp. damselae]
MIKIKSLLLGLALFSTQSAHAALTMDNTRYIFEGEKQSIPLKVTNQAPHNYAAQVWIDSNKENTPQDTFVVSPAFFKIDKGARQIIRIMNIGANLPQDKESLFWINLQEIPPKSKENGLVIAIRTRVKLIYRPTALDAGRNRAEEQLTIQHVPGEKWLVNTTPYIFAINKLLDSESNAITIKKSIQDKMGTFLPGDKINITGKDVKAVDAVNDYGDSAIYTIKSA